MENKISGTNYRPMVKNVVIAIKAY